MTEKRNIHALIEKEAPSLNNLLDPEDVKEFKAMTTELRDTWTKKQVFRTETEMRMSVLQDMKYPTKAAKYWQCVSCLLYTSPSPRDLSTSRMPSSA